MPVSKIAALAGINLFHYYNFLNPIVLQISATVGSVSSTEWANRALLLYPKSLKPVGLEGRKLMQEQ
jgi:hypothetical protein